MHGAANWGLVKSKWQHVDWGRKPEHEVPLSQWWPFCFFSLLIFPSLELKAAQNLELYTKYRWRAPRKALCFWGRKWRTYRERSERVREVSCVTSPPPPATPISPSQSPGNSIAVAGAYNSTEGKPFSLVSETIVPKAWANTCWFFSLFIPLPQGPGSRYYMKKYMAVQRNENLLFLVRGAPGVKKHQGDPRVETASKRLSLKVVMWSPEFAPEQCMHRFDLMKHTDNVENWIRG